MAATFRFVDHISAIEKLRDVFATVHAEAHLPTGRKGRCHGQVRIATIVLYLKERT